MRIRTLVTTAALIATVTAAAAGCGGSDSEAESEAAPTAASTAAAPVLGARPPVTLVRGLCASIKSDSVVIKTTQDERTVALGPDSKFATISPARLADITKDSFVGVSARQTGEGLEAVEVHIFPAELRGSGEGHYPWDNPGTATTSMTNATITEVVADVDGPVLTLRPKGQDVKITVPPSAQLVQIKLADSTVARDGADCVVTSTADEEGRLTARTVSVGKDGAKPPF